MLSCRREMSVPSQEWTLKSSARSRGTNSSSRLSDFIRTELFRDPVVEVTCESLSRNQT